MVKARIGISTGNIVLCLVILLFGCAKQTSDEQAHPTIQIDSNIENGQTLQDVFFENLVRPADEMEMVYIPRGTFQMGSTQNEIESAIQLCREHYPTCNRWYYEREGPVHAVTLEGYWFDQAEVSNQQYLLCVEDGIYTEPLTCKKGEPTYGDPSKSNHPVICVSWNDADNYCQWAGARLPTEAEWEYANRGETRTLYAWGDEFDGAKLNYCDINCDQDHADGRYDDNYSKTAPVRSYPEGASWSGVYNISGNVSEWVADWFWPYSPESLINPLGPTDGTQKMLKGCAWFSPPVYCRAAARPAADPDTKFDYLGFRCAASIEENHDQ